MEKKDLQNVIRELSKVVPSSHLASTGLSLDLLNSLYGNMWFRHNNKTSGYLNLPYIGNNTKDKIDKAVHEAYGMGRDADTLQFLLNLNGRLYEREKNGENVQGPGLPNKIKDKSAIVSEDCVQVTG